MPNVRWHLTDIFSSLATRMLLSIDCPAFPTFQLLEVNFKHDLKFQDECKVLILISYFDKILLLKRK